jgi:hypothetical protein
MVEKSGRNVISVINRWEQDRDGGFVRSYLVAKSVGV